MQSALREGLDNSCAAGVTYGLHVCNPAVTGSWHNIPVLDLPDLGTSAQLRRSSLNTLGGVVHIGVSPRLSRGTGWRLAALAVVGAVVLAGCTSPSTSAGATVGESLTVVAVIAPQTLDPAKTAQNNAWLEQLAYEPLIVRKSDGTLVPGLAESWRYEGNDNTTFVLKLRSGVKFSDGTELTAQTVVDHLTYVVTAAGQMAPFLAGNTFTATDPLTVTIKAPSPNPDFPVLLTQDYII